MNKKFLLLLILALVVIGAVGTVAYLQLNKPAAPVQNVPPGETATDPLNATYVIENVPVTLVNGRAETTVGDTKTITALFEQPVIGDLNNDDAGDAGTILVQNMGGSGTFFYAAAFVSGANGAQGTNAILLGDRISPQSIEIRDGRFIVNYADRKPGEPMTTPPSVGASAYFVVEGTTLKKSAASTQEITYLISKEPTTNYCDGEKMDSAGYAQTITTEQTTSTPEVNPTNLQIVKATIRAATTGMCHDVLSGLPISLENGVVTIPAIDGWAGVSITMCSCKPQVEANVLRIPGMTQVIWE